MPTIMKELDAETRNKLVSRYFWGESAIFAKMLHDAFGWPLVGMVVGKLVRHAGVRHPDGTILDSRGFHVTDEDFAAAFVDEQPDYVVQDIEPEDIREVHNVTGLAKNRARIAAQHILPNLSWPTHKRYSVRMTNLASAIERVSAQYGYRLQLASSAGEPPRILLVPSNGEECTYALTPEGADGVYALELCKPEMVQAAK